MFIIAKHNQLSLRHFIALFIFLFSFSAKAQTITLPEGEFMDTTTVADTSCPGVLPYYYSVGGKYSKNSASLLKDVHAYLAMRKNEYAGNGYITFRFPVNCHGRLVKNVQVMQTDEKYRSYSFSPKFVKDLYNFILSMDKWKPGKSHQGTPLSYMAYISFKIEDGKVVQIIP